MIEKNNLHDAVICKETDSVLEVAKILRDTQTRHLLVVNKNLAPVGVISTVDINNRVIAEEKDPKSLKASQVMTKPLDTIDINASYQEAYEKMIKKATYSIPVTEQGKLIGILDFNLIFKKVTQKK